MNTARLLVFPLFLTIGLVLAGCDSTEDDTSGPVTLTGQVLNSQTNNPVPNAFVRTLPYDLLFETDQDGFYTIDVEVDSTMELTLVATKDGFTESTTRVLAIAERVIEVPTFRLTQTAEPEPESGLASNIILLEQSSQSIGVRESGSTEVANISFQVRDSLGRPVILGNDAQVNFSFGQAPGGGEFIFPESAQTDNNGTVTVNLSSGNIAGVVQLVAETVVAGRPIRSLPVSVTIHGGLPAQSHFSLGPAQTNFPGLTRYGLENEISVIVGDEFSNPVKPGTAVYFNTTGGIIEGSTLTGPEGGGVVSLISANPLPEQGIALVRAFTADKNKDEVTSTTAVVFSGGPVITVSPAVARLNQTYQVTVTDRNGNPLAPGNVFRAVVEGTKVKAVGNTGVTIDDTVFDGGLAYENIVRGPGITEFTFRAVEDQEVDEAGVPTVETVTIGIDGPNGDLEIVLVTGDSPFTRTQDATILELGNQTVRATLD
ncbi:MAG: hypothetical protein AAGI71_04795 [Bacteroidota bacterium]